MELEVRVEDRDVEDAGDEFTDEIEFETTVGETDVKDACTVDDVEATIDVVEATIDEVEATTIDEVEAVEVGGGSTEETVPEDVAFIDDELGI